MTLGMFSVYIGKLSKYKYMMLNDAILCQHGDSGMYADE